MVGTPRGEPSGKVRKREVKLTLVIRMTRELPADWTDEDVQFHIEENLCRDNLVEQLAREIQAKPNVCCTCHRSEAFVGHLKLEAFVGHLKLEADGKTS
jgi:hypothetical protein